MSRFGKCEGYTGTPCPQCGRYRLEHYSKGFEICEKCEWCVQLEEYVDTWEEEDGDGEKSMEEFEALLREKEPFMFEWHDGGDDIY